MSLFQSLARVRLGRRFGAAVTLVIIAVSSVWLQSAFGANPITDAIKNGDVVDPQVNSWLAIQTSLQQFLHWDFILRLFLSLSLAIVCGWVLAWHPRSDNIAAPTNLEERKILVLLGLVGAVVSELSEVNATLAFVIFGIGALLRFRTLLDNPRLTGKAVMVMVVGLACGMGAWAMAVFVTAFSWALIYYMDSHVACRLRVRLAHEADPEVTLAAVRSFLASQGCRVQSATIYKGKRRLDLVLHVPAQFDLKQLEMDLRATLPKAVDARVDCKAV
jgi:hypothetical protein